MVQSFCLPWAQLLTEWEFTGTLCDVNLFFGGFTAFHFLLKMATYDWSFWGEALLNSIISWTLSLLWKQSVVYYSTHRYPSKQTVFTHFMNND